MPEIRYQIYLHKKVADSLRSIRGNQKRAVEDFLDGLYKDPFIHGDFVKHLATRDLEVKVIGRYSIYYYADHAAKEIKVVELLRSDRSS